MYAYRFIGQIQLFQICGRFIGPFPGGLLYYTKIGTYAPRHSTWPLALGYLFVRNFSVHIGATSVSDLAWTSIGQIQLFQICGRVVCIVS